MHEHPDHFEPSRDRGTFDSFSCTCKLADVGGELVRPAIFELATPRPPIKRARKWRQDKVGRMTPKITASIVLPTAGADLALLTRTLETLAASQLDSGVVETVLVDNGDRRSEISLDPKTQERLRLRREHIPIRNKSGALNHVLPYILRPCCRRA